ncbi:MAG: clan AA aspartic protease [Chloroflexi bacterium]|nr:clan AA aspartic protease [Chloroflexota bacterium]
MVSIQGSDGAFHQCRVILDTGFTGALTLPETVIRELGLISEGRRSVITARGESEGFEFFTGWVSWHGILTEVGVFQSIDQPLLGMELLEGCHVALDARDGGEVVIDERAL